jgi:hypothetical protein
VASGVDWRIYKVTSEKAIDPKSLLICVDRQYVATTDYIELNKAIDFRDIQYFLKGWSIPESTHRWSEGKEAIVAFRLKKGSCSAQKTYSLIMSAGSLGNQRVTILINKKEIGDLIFSDTSETKKIHFYSNILHEKGLNTITMKIPNAHAPGSDDKRILGIRFNNLIISEQQ